MDTNLHEWGWVKTPAVLLMAVFAACGKPQASVLGGEAMGTAWRVTIAAPMESAAEAEELRKAIAERIEGIEAKVSHWREDSEVSKMSREGAMAEIEVSEETAMLVSFGEEMSERTGGAFSVKVAEEVATRGFGPARLKRGEEPRLAIDLSGLAKGYAVDKMGAVLDGAGVTDYLIEFGGELKGRGAKASGAPWVVGIEAPDPAGRRVEVLVELGDEALATSGNYRLFREGEEGKVESHLVDPRDPGWREEGFFLVSVLHPSAMEADAWATAFFVMGEEETMEQAEKEGMGVLFLRLEEDGNVRRVMNEAFRDRVIESDE